MPQKHISETSRNWKKLKKYVAQRREKHIFSIFLRQIRDRIFISWENPCTAVPMQKSLIWPRGDPLKNFSTKPITYCLTEWKEGYIPTDQVEVK